VATRSGGFSGARGLAFIPDQGDNLAARKEVKGSCRPYEGANAGMRVLESATTVVPRLERAHKGIMWHMKDGCEV
jgi:hypothetical protein